MAEVYRKVGKEKIQRLIALHVDVQDELGDQIEDIAGRARRNLAQAKSRHMSPEAAKRYRRGRHPSKVYTTVADIDHHAVLEGSAGLALQKGTTRDAALEIMREAL